MNFKTPVFRKVAAYAAPLVVTVTFGCANQSNTVRSHFRNQTALAENLESDACRTEDGIRFGEKKHVIKSKETLILDSDRGTAKVTLYQDTKHLVINYNRSAVMIEPQEFCP